MTRRRPTPRRGAAAALLLAAFSAGSAAADGVARISTPEDLARGTLDGTWIDVDGRLALAPEVSTVWGPETGIVWQVAAADAGLFAALSGPARLLRVDADGEPAVWHAAEAERLYTAVAVLGGRAAAVGVAPTGEVWRFDGPGGGRILLETDAAFVWALAAGDEDDLFVGTGLPGRVLRYADGRTTTLHETAEDPVRVLLPIGDGAVVAGTGGEGRVVRVAADGTPFVLLDADEPEIVALALGDDGAIHALAVGGAKLPGRSDATERPVGQTVTVRANPDGPGRGDDDDDDRDGSDAGSDERSADRRETVQTLTARPGGTIYRIEPDGAVHAIWSTADEMPFAMAPLPDGRLVVATGENGRLHVVDPERRRGASLLRVAANQASALAVATDGSIWVGTTEDARIERVEPRPRREGRWLSAPIDAGAVARWGRVAMHDVAASAGTTRVEIRVGNTERPDATWSPWTAADAEAPPPSSRRAQVRVTLAAGRRGGSPRIGGVDVHYRPRNRAPRIDDLRIEPAGVFWVAGPDNGGSRVGPVIADDPVARRALERIETRRANGTAGIRRGYEPGARTFRWSATDEDDDRLRAHVDVRREGTEVWFPIARDIETPWFSWDARGLPDGAYRVRVTVDDSADHPEGEGATDRRVSDLFRLDGTRPTIGDLRVRSDEGGWHVAFEALDADGGVAAVEVAVDGGEWRPLAPLDGVADSPRERFEVRIDADGGVHERAIRLRVTDAAGNLGGRMERLTRGDGG